MMYPERMQRVAIVGPKARLKQTIDILHEHGVLHIVEHRKDTLDIGSPIPGSEQLSDQLIRTRSLMHALGLPPRDEPADEWQLRGELTERLAVIATSIGTNQRERKQLDERFAKLTNTKQGPYTERDREAAERALEANTAARARLRAEHAEFLYATESFLTIESRKAQTPLRFAVSKHAFLVNGWVPVKEIARLSSDLDQKLEKEIAVQTVTTTEDAPIKLDNSQVVQPYETLLRLYTLPKYHEVDPSTFLFLSFPIFFGFILGDIGYGLILLLAAIAMRRIYKHSHMMSAVSSILIASAASSIVFGFVYGEWFGAESIGPIELHPYVHRATDIQTLLIVSLIVGILHLTIALLTGFVQETRHHGIWKGFCAKASWLFLLLGAGLILAAKELGTHTFTWGVGIAGASIILIIIGEGVRGIIELPGIFSNIASYARLMAVGVASAGLAIVINQLAGGLIASASVGMIILGLFVLILGHTVNIALGILGSFIHGLRLNYVEFFSKFYEGGGKPYKPFGGRDE